MPTTIGDALAKNQILAWRGISFPVASLSTEFAQSVVQHEFVDRDGAKLEATGRKSLVISCNALFYNGAVFDISTNTSQSTYPAVYQAVLFACSDRSTGTLIHPELGSLQAKCVSFKAAIQAERRDGATVAITWVEHVQDSATLGEASPLSFAVSTSAQLDSALALLKVKSAILAQQLNAIDPLLSFTKLCQQIQSTADSVSLLSKRGSAIIPGIQYRLGKVSDALDAAGTTTVHAARELVEQLKSALNAIAAQQFATQQVLLYGVPADTTMGALATTLAVPSTQLVQLNPSLAAASIVKRGTVVRYMLTKTK